MSAQLDYVILLYKQEKYAQAAEQCKKLLQEDPEDVYVIYLLSTILLEQRKLDEALKTIQSGMAIAPEFALFHYAQAIYFYYKNKTKDALKSLAEALKLNPFDDDFYTLKAQILMHDKEFSKALIAANEALKFNPENTTALNHRSKCLARLGNKTEALDALHKSLELDPNNEATFTNLGYRALEDGNHIQALESFKEALKLQPNNVVAQEGMKEALKSKYWFYRKYLSFEFWLEEHRRNIFYVVIAINVLIKAAGAYSMLLSILLIMSFLAIRLIKPLSNVYLLLHPFGKLILDKREKLTARVIGSGFGLATLLGITYLITQNTTFAGISFGLFLMLVPLSVSLGNVFVNKLWTGISWTISIVAIILMLLSSTVSIATGVVINDFSVWLLVLVCLFTWVF